MSRVVLILEDDAELGAQLVRHLDRAGLEARWLEDADGLDVEVMRDVALVVLDLMLPSRHGFDLLAELRTFSDVPVLILTARNQTADKVRSYRLGADDYMTKPFWPEVFVERVRARLRRPSLERDGRLVVGALAIDREARQATIDDAPLTLTRAEFDILVMLAERKGAAVTRRALVERVLDPDGEGNERTLDVHVSRLRKKLGATDLIETVWGIGYRVKAAP